MPDGTAAKSAIQGANGKELAGRALTVNEAKPREPRREPVRIAGKHPIHTERATFRACGMQTAIRKDGRCWLCALLPCRLLW